MELGDSESDVSLDILNLTLPQKTVLLAIWGLLKKNIDLHAKAIFLIFFEDYPQYLEKFDPLKSETHVLADNRFLHKHAIYVLNSLGTLIEFGLNDILLFDCTLVRIARNHKSRNISKEDVQVCHATLSMYIYL